MIRISHQIYRIRLLIVVNMLATLTVVARANLTTSEGSIVTSLICAVAVLISAIILLTNLNNARQGVRKKESEFSKEIKELKDNYNRLKCNISDKQRENEYLAIASARFEELFHGVPFGCFTVDDVGKIFEWNSAASDLFETPSHLAIQRTVFEGLFDDASTNRLAEALEKALNGVSVRNLELRTATGTSPKHLLVNIFAIGGNQSHTALMIACADISRLVIAERTILEQNDLLNKAMIEVNENSLMLEVQRLELIEKNDALNRLATTDGITGLLNHRAMQSELLSAIERSKHNNSQIGVLLLDVDHFKSFNDQFGHQVGDEVLKNIGKILLASVRDTDAVARYGGEEFCVILPAIDAYECKLVCENIRHNVECADWPHRQVTISVGFVIGDGTSVSADLVKCADIALYQAKGTGRNRVCMYRSSSTHCA